MNDLKIQQVWNDSYADFSEHHPESPEQVKTSHSILNCKTGMLGATISQCADCGHIEYHNNSCRNRNCPNCQAVKKELWVDKRRAEVIDSPYFHVVFTLPHELNPLLYHNQKLLYSLLHRCSAETLLELSADKKYLGATPGIIQVLHTWNQTLDYHVHMHCIVSGGGITPDGKIRKSKGKFFIPVFVLQDKFKGKFLCHLNVLYQSGVLKVPLSFFKQETSVCWNTFKDSLYQKDWCPYIKKHSMGLVMQSNILDAIPTRLLSLTAGSFLSRIHIQHSAHVAEFPVIPVVRSLSVMKSLSGDSLYMCFQPVSRKSTITAF